MEELLKLLKENIFELDEFDSVLLKGIIEKLEKIISEKLENGVGTGSTVPSLKPHEQEFCIQILKANGIEIESIEQLKEPSKQK